MNGARDYSTQVHDYETAGFNGFFRRTIGSNPNATTLRAMSGNNQRQLNFDNQQLSGAMGDNLRLGTIRLDGKTGRISVFDEQGNEVIRIGDMND